MFEQKIYSDHDAEPLVPSGVNTRSAADGMLEGVAKLIPIAPSLT
jgi:hypothetical protein